MDMSIYGLFVLPLPRISFYSCIFYLVNSFQYFGDFLSKATPAGMGETIAYRLLENKEPSDSIGIIIAVIIDVNY